MDQKVGFWPAKRNDDFSKTFKNFILRKEGGVPERAPAKVLFMRIYGGSIIRICKNRSIFSVYLWEYDGRDPGELRRRDPDPG